MLGISGQASRIIYRTTTFVMFSGLLSSMTLFAGIIEDEARLENVFDLRSCFDTFRNVTQENVQIADKNNVEKAQLAVNHVLSSLNFWESNPGDWQSVAWDLYPKFARAYALLHGLEFKFNEQFVQDGFRQGTIDEDLNLNFLNAFQYAKAIPFIHERFKTHIIRTKRARYRMYWHALACC
ncbi:MAG: hypothetical protein NTY13_02600 [Chlamydiae bacterium]|nr:hypothetical protein [Chlamydiota bacterium]